MNGAPSACRLIRVKWLLVGRENEGKAWATIGSQRIIILSLSQRRLNTDHTEKVTLVTLVIHTRHRSWKPNQAVRATKNHTRASR